MGHGQRGRGAGVPRGAGAQPHMGNANGHANGHGNGSGGGYGGGYGDGTGHRGSVERVSDASSRGQPSGGANIGNGLGHGAHNLREAGDGRDTGHGHRAHNLRTGVEAHNLRTGVENAAGGEAVRERATSSPLIPKP